MNACINSSTLAFACLITSAAVASTYHFTPTGSGNRSGDSFENAFSEKDIQPKLDAVEPGDVFQLGSGTYRPPYDNNRLLVFRSGGTAEKPIAFRGVDTGGGLPIIDIIYQRCTARNNRSQREAGDYWNGDGFVAENASHGIAYEDCVAIDNTDRIGFPR